MELKQSSILVVDDEPFLREIMGGWLARVAGQVFSAENGVKALEILAANKVHLILSDIRMPVMDGITLLKKIKEARVCTPEVIFLSGFSDVPLREAYDMGAEAVLEKPISRGELLDIAKRALTEVDELWRNPPCAALETKLEMTFRSLATALEEKRIGVGRRGFCIDTAADLSEGPVEFTLEFEDDRLVLSGQGVVRWTAPKEGRVGIEITCLREASHTWMVDHVKRNKPFAFIPGFTGRDSSLQPKVA
jgi:CheY-like chemotaxis protein